MTVNQRELIISASVRDHFQESVTMAIEKQQVAADQHTIAYIVNLLTEFSRAEQLFDHTDQGVELKPLAFLFGEAIEADHPELRNRALKRLGDIALFISGVLPDSLHRKLVDLDYFIAMGGNAYSHLSDVLRGSPFALNRSQVFEELAEKFTDFVDVLAEVSTQPSQASDRDTLRYYELWLKTGSKRASRQLAELGIYVSGFASRTRH